MPPHAGEDVDSLREQIQALQLQQKQLEALLLSQQHTPSASTLRNHSPFAERPDHPTTAPLDTTTRALPTTVLLDTTVPLDHATTAPHHRSPDRPSPPAPDGSLPASFPVADSQGQVQPPPILRAVPRSTVRPELCGSHSTPVVWPHDEQQPAESSSQESVLKEGSKLVAKGLRGTMKSAVKLWFTLADKADEYAAQTKGERKASKGR